MTDALGYYAVLEISSDASLDLIKNKYRDLAKFWHPDRNNSKDALEHFQKISEAWDILSDEDKRQNYDLLSTVYTSRNYPDMDNIVPFGDGNTDVRALTLSRVRAWVASYKDDVRFIVADYKQACVEHIKNAMLNWLLGWWHPKAFLKNCLAMRKNWKYPIAESETKKILVHNLVYYKLHGQVDKVKIMARHALRYADDDLKRILLNLLGRTDNKHLLDKDWNVWNLRLGQLVFPLGMVVLLMVPMGSKYVSELELLNWFSKKNEITYYQEVKFVEGERGVDDVVVGKVLSIPVDRRDVSRLYHLQTEEKIMYGPGDDFDVLKVLKAGTTVRLTGVTPDNVWSRVMIDNGEMGFIRTENIVSGIGTEIPYGSQIFQE